MTDTPPVDHDQVRARRYPHPAMDRPVVRLVPDGVGEATDAAMAYLGFDAPTVYEPSLTAPRRPLGYPGWALVHDPDNAPAALAVAKDMRKAAAQADAKPKAASDAFWQIGKRVPVGHLPALFEQAAREFLDADRLYWASYYFGKAREAEQVHALPVDPETRRMSYIEFAVSGAVSIKALKAYAGELRREYEGPEAYDVFLDLAMRRTKAGVAPWAGMVAEFKALAKGAELNADTVLDDLVRRLLRLPATRRAPGGFWTSVTSILARLVKTDEDVRRRVVELFPEEDGWWWPFLLRFDAASAIRDVPGWLQRAHAQAGQGWRRETVPDALLDLVPSLAPYASAPIDPASWADQWGAIDAELAEACVAAGMDVAVPAEPTYFEFQRWRTRTGLAAIASRPEWHGVLRRSIAVFLRSNGAAPLLEQETLRPFVDAELRSWIARAEGAGLADLQDLFDHLDRALSGVNQEGDASVSISPEINEAIARVDVARALVNALRTGVADEYGWPALDEAMSQLKRLAGYSTSWPVLSVWDHRQVFAVGPAGIVGRFSLPSGDKSSNLTALWSDGRFLIADGWGDREAYWSDAPDEVFTVPYMHYSSLHNGLGYTLLDGEGLRMSHGAPLRGGAQQLPDESFGAPHVLHDGTAYWDATGADEGVRRIDPVTGARDAEPSLPAFLAGAAVPEGDVLAVSHCSLAPLPEGAADTPLGSAGGLVGAWVTEPAARPEGYQPGVGAFTSTIAHVDGRTVTVATRGDNAWLPNALIGYPGASEAAVLTTQARQIGLADPGTGATHWRACVGRGDGKKTTSSCKAAFGATMVPPAAFWHFLRPRDEAASKTLRSIDVAWVESMLTFPNKELFEAVKAKLGTEDARLVNGVIGVIKLARAEAGRRERLTRRKPAPVVPRIDTALLARASEGLVQHGYAAGRQPVLEHIELSSRLHGGEPGGFDKQMRHNMDAYVWSDLLDGVETLAWRAALACTPDRMREPLLTLLDVWAGSVYADPAVSVRRSHVESAAYDKQMSAEARESKVNTVDGRVDIRFGDKVLSVGGEGVPTTATHSGVHTPGWGTGERIRRFTALVRERGPIAWDAEAVQVFTDATGVSRSAASWLLATIPEHGGWGTDKEWTKLLKDAFGLKAKVLDAGHSELSSSRFQALRRLYAGALPDDPAELWAEGGVRALAGRLAERWVAERGRRTAVPEETLAAMTEHNPFGAIGRTLQAMADPESQPCLTTDTDTRLVRPSGPNSEVAVDHSGDTTLQELLPGIVQGLYVAYYHLPAGDPVRAAVPRLVELIRARLSHPGLIMAGQKRWEDEEDILRIRETVGRERFANPGGAYLADVVDGGPIVLEFGQRMVNVFVRPALIDDGPVSKLTRTLAEGWRNPLHMVDWVRSWGMTEIAARVAADDLPHGAYEANPAASAPELVAEVAAEHGISGDAAALYLQLLTLPDPTDRNVRLWNGWKAAAHRKAVDELLSRKLVMEAVRARAGRKVFIPGPWTVAHAPLLPLETYKTELYDGPSNRYLPLCPLPVLFAECRRRALEEAAGEGKTAP